MNAIEIKNLTKSYPGFQLDRLNLNLPKGYIMGLVGENGAGKSTTIKLLLGMLRPDSGESRLLGQTVPNMEDIGVVLDESGFPECLNALQVGKVLSEIYKRWDMEYYYALLRRFSLPLEKKFSDFSKGMKMKLSIAAALAHKPSLLILDEATSGLDPVVRDDVLDLLMDFTRDGNHSILISSHIVSDLEKLCDYIAFLHKGKLMLMEEKDTLYDRYVVVLCSSEELASIPSHAVKGKKESRYGIEAIVDRSYVPENITTTPISIEDLFIFMVKEDSK